MNVRNLLRHSDTLLGLVRDARRLGGVPRHLARLGRRAARIEAYTRAHAVRKLHIGAGPAEIDGWLNTDIEPRSRRSVYLDATRRFPLADASFDYVFSEHMIEHIPWSAGLFMLGECRRVLRPGGTVRIATPDLEVFLGLYHHEDDPQRLRYVRWVTERYLNGLGECRASFVINNIFREWGHQFLYDAELLTLALANAGFARVRRVCPGQSADPHLRGIEAHGRVVQDEEMGAFETMVLEADRPD